MGNDPQRARDHLLQALAICKQEGFKKEEAHCAYSLGNIYRMTGDNLKAEAYLLQSISLLKNLGYENALSKCYNNLGIVYKNIGNYPKAMDYYSKGLSLAEKHGDKEEILNFYSNISVLYILQGSYARAKTNINRSLEIAAEIESYDAVFVAYFNVGSIFKDKGDYESAVEYFYKALDLNEQMGNRMQEANVKMNLSQIFMQRKDWVEAYKNLLSTKAILEELGLQVDLASVLNDLGQTSYNMGHLEEAISYLEQAQILAEKSSYRLLLMSIHLNQAFAYEKTADYKKAFEHHIAYAILKDSLRDIEKNKIMFELQEKYETEKREKEMLVLIKDRAESRAALKEQKMLQMESELETGRKSKQIELLKKDKAIREGQMRLKKIEAEKQKSQIDLLVQNKELQEAKLNEKEAQMNQQLVIRNAFIIGFLAMLVAAVFLRFFYNQKINAQRALQKQLEENNRQKVMDLIKDNKIKAIQSHMEGQQQERERIAREIHDGIGGNLASIKLGLQMMAERMDDKKMPQILEAIDFTCQEVRSISHDLMPPRLLHSQFSELLSSYVQQINEAYPIEITSNFYPETGLNSLSDELQVEIYRIIQELVNNLIKHAQADSADLQLVLHENFVNLMLEDNGKGFDITKKMHGIGLQNIIDRVKKLEGAINIDSSIGHGTSITLDLPLSRKPAAVIGAN